MYKVLCQKKGNTFSKVVAELANATRVFPWEVEVAAPGGECDTIFNWGTSVSPPYTGATLYNDPSAVSRVVSKRACFGFCKALDLPTVPWTTSHTVAKNWFEDNKTVYCRVLSSSSGAKGLVVSNKNKPHGQPSLVPSKLYTRFFKSTFEVRVFASSWIDEKLVLIKKRMSAETLEKNGLSKANYWIRNMDNGWVYLLPSSEEQSLVPPLGSTALMYANAFGLDYAAVDLAVVVEEGTPTDVRLIEINSAPGILRDETKTWFKKVFDAIKEVD